MKTKMRAVMSYVEEDQDRKLRAILASRGTTFSEWVRECMDGAVNIGWPIMSTAKGATIDGVQCEEGTRVRVRLGPKAKQNGVWIAKAGKWTDDKGGKAKRGKA